MKELLYDKFSKYYDCIYSTKDYDKEVAFVLEQTDRESRSLDILDLACGTGEHAVRFASQGHNVQGLDISEKMIELAKGKGAGVSFLRGDFTKLDYDSEFDLVTLLFTSVNYCDGLADLGKTFQQVHRSLRQKGVFIFDVGLTKIQGQSGEDNFIDSATKDSMEVARISNWKPMNKERSKFKAKYLIFVKEDGQVVDFGVDTHVLSAFSLSQIKDSLLAAGFNEIAIYNGYNKQRIESSGNYRGIPVFVAKK